MEIPLAFLADEANISQDGKLNVLGVFDRIATPHFPTVHPKMVFGFRVQAGFEDGGRSFSAVVRLVDEDGGPLFEAQGEISIPPIPPGEFFTANQVFALVGVQFTQPGTYKFMVVAADRVLNETPFVVSQIRLA